MSGFAVVGKQYPRTDGVARVTGQERYTCRWRLCRGACGNAASLLIPGFMEERNVYL